MAEEALKYEMTGKGITILIVDDEVGICRTLEGVFKDEGFHSIIAHDGISAMEVLTRMRPALVLLDIWMPGLDGIETLKRIKELHADLPVIMISGHATIATAMQATKLGAADFIEKPLDLDVILQAIKKALSHSDEESAAPEDLDTDTVVKDDLQIGQAFDKLDINPIAFASQSMPGRKVPQRTLAHSALLYGQGLHSGTKSGLILEPLPPNSGIHFVGVSEGSAVPAHVDFVESTGLATTLRLGLTQAGTIEHLMSTLRAYGISNLLVKCNGEVPVMDGSATEFCNLLDETGIEEQAGDWYGIEITDRIRVGEGEEFIQLEPAEGFVIDYTLEYPDPIGVQRLLFSLEDAETFRKEIAPARTFGLVKDIGALQKQGLAQGGRFDNFVLIGEGGVINAELRFPDEAVRHKILDLIGDLYLLGRPIQGKVTARMTGHSDNIALLKALQERMT